MSSTDQSRPARSEWTNRRRVEPRQGSVVRITDEARQALDALQEIRGGTKVEVLSTLILAALEGARRMQ